MGMDAFAPCGKHCNDTQVGPEFLNIAASLKKSPPHQPWAAALVKQRKADQSKDAQRSLPSRMVGVPIRCLIGR
jgi:hypothetical protein